MQKKIPENRLLAALPRSESKQIEGLMEEVTLKRREVILDPGDPINFVLFPLTCTVVLSHAFPSGESVITNIIGNDGVICAASALGTRVSSPGRYVVQADGRALKLPVAEYGRVFSGLPTLNLLIRTWVADLVTELMISVACSRLHPAERRLARWLLQVMDRSFEEQLWLTVSLR